MLRFVAPIFVFLSFVVLTLIGFATSTTDDATSEGRTSENKSGTDDDPDWNVEPPDLSEEIVKADNSYCLVCHVNFEKEELVAAHQPVGVGCETCHGMSDDHSADEDNVTPPEILWHESRINRRCMTCHGENVLMESTIGSIAHERLIDRLKNPPAEIQEEADDDEKRYCVDCHGEHRMAHRTRVWDKMTGELLEESGGPRMDQ